LNFVTFASVEVLRSALLVFVTQQKSVMMRQVWLCYRNWNVFFICSLYGSGSRQVQWRIQTRRLGGRQKYLHLLKCQRLSATIVECHMKVVTFCRSKSGYFCWSNYAIYQGITTVWKRFISLIQRTFETSPKQWASFFTSYTDLVYLQNVFKRYKLMLRASACHCFSYPEQNQWRTMSETHSRPG